MNIFHHKDYANVAGWFSYQALTPQAEEKQLLDVDEKVRAPLAFGFLKSDNLNKGTLQVYQPEVMKAHGWKPLLWKESNHNDHTFLTLWMKEYPEYKDTIVAAALDIKAMVHVGCSTVVKEFVAREAKPDFFNPNTWTHAQETMRFFRFERPLSLIALTKLRVSNYTRVAMTKHSQYWAWGKKGIGSKEECEY